MALVLFAMDAVALGAEAKNCVAWNAVAWNVVVMMLTEIVEVGWVGGDALHNVLLEADKAHLLLHSLGILPAHQLNTSYNRIGPTYCSA